MPGCARAWKWMEGEIGHWLVHPLCPRNQFILPPCPVPGLEWKDGWKEVRTEANPSPPSQSPQYRAQLTLFSSEWFIQIAMSWEKKEWLGRLYVWVSLFNLPATLRGRGRGLSWGGVWGYYFSFIEEKIEACKCLMWGFNVWTERSICILAAQMVYTGWMVWVPLPAPACWVLPLRVSRYSWHHQLHPGRAEHEITASWTSNNHTYFTWLCCCPYTVGKPLSRLLGLNVPLFAVTLGQCLQHTSWFSID